MKYLDLTGLRRVKDKIVALIPTVDSALSSSSENPVQNKVIKSALDGKAASSHSHLYSQITVPTDYVQNGGPDNVSRFGVQETRACKTAFLPPEAITVEYTTDGGTTWTDYGATDVQKQELVTCRYSGNFKYGGPSCTTVTNQIGLRITLNPTDRYCYVNMAYLWVNSVAHTCKVSLEYSTIGAKTTFTSLNSGKQYQITGWTGGNMLYFPGGTFGGGSTQYYNRYAYRFTFMCTAVNSDWINAVPTIIDLRMYGTSTWTAPNEMMKTDHLYSWDRNKNATFPATVTATNFAGKINNHTVNKDVPSDAVFTDTTYNNATTTTAGLMSSIDKTKLNNLVVDGDSQSTTNAYSANYINTTYKNTILNAVYPVGSIYMSVNSTSPATLFGGTWVQLKDRFLLGAGDTYTNGDTGGEATHQLTYNEMPSHTHGMRVSVNGSTGGGARVILQPKGVTNSDPDIGAGDTLGAGNNWAHNNMPPYLTVYMWKRTA